MLAQPYRFHSRGGIRYVYQKGKTIRTPVLSLVYLPNSRGFQRFGVVISKKILKSAVGRNRIRRRIYEAIRLELPNYPYKMDCVFVIYNKNFLNMPFSELQQTLRELLSRTITE